ncbi:MAG: hypothetical protein RIS34_1532, partial [Pseudomonadota bacterium]
RCPACETLFKVVPDQLRISDGWVRCGQCEEIFDASVHLQPTSPSTDSTHGNSPADHSVPEPDESEPALEALPESGDVTGTMDEGAAENPLPLPAMAPGSDVLVDSPVDLDVTKTDVGDSDSSWRPVSEAFTANAWEDESVADHIEMPPVVPLATELEQIVARRSMSAIQDALPAPSEATEVNPTQIEAEGELSDLLETPGLSFMRESNAHSLWRKPLVRVVMGALAVMLLAGLCLQILVQERDRIVAFEPATRPWMITICSVLSCSISPVRQIESIVIESSSFTQIRGDSYRLNFVIKSVASVALALPAVELALTDTQDKAVIRRVFSPADFTSNSGTLAAGSELAASLTINVKSDGKTDRIAGYRVLAFYP